MTYLLFFGLAFVAITVGIRYFLVFQRLLKLGLQPTRFEVLLPETVPEFIQPIFQSPLKALEALEFYPCYVLQIDALIYIPDQKTWAMLFYNRRHQTYAIAEVRSNADPTYVFNLEFYTFFKDSTLLLTTNGKASGTIGTMPYTLLQDFYTGKLEVQWQKHLETLKQQLDANQHLWKLAPLAFLKQLERHLDLYLAALVQTKQITRIKGTFLYQMNVLTALKTTHNAIQGNPKIAAIGQELLNLSKQQPELKTEIPLELEIQGFRTIRAIEQGTIHRPIKPWVLGITLILFCVSVTPLINFQIQGLLLLLATLFLHEFGHYLIMRYYGYQDTSIFFIPFFGAAAVGQKHTATVTEKFWVLMAGPLPGLLLGLGIAIAIQDQGYSWLTEWSWMLIVLNLLNLLPILPLDGGKIASLLIFSRYPYTDILFKVFAVFVLGLLGLSGSPIWWMIAIAVASTIPLGFRSAKLDQKLRHELQSQQNHTLDQLLYHIFKVIKDASAHQLNFNQRYSLAKDLLYRHREANTQWFVRLAFSLGYSFCLVGGFVGTLQALTPDWFQTVSLYVNPQGSLKQKLRDLNVTIEQDPQNAQAYYERTQLKLRIRRLESNPEQKAKFTQEALKDINQSIQIEPNRADAYYLRSAVHSMLGDEQQSEQDIKTAFSLNTREQIEQSTQRLQANPKDISSLLLRGQAKAELGDMTGALQDYDQAVKIEPNNFEVYYYRSQFYYRQKNYSKALTEINQSLKIDPEYGVAYYFRSKIYLQLGEQAKAEADQKKAEELENKQLENSD